jgi:Type VI secretion system, TssO
MPPTNVQARRKAFINFLILFIITAGIIITTFFFSIRVPFRQVNQLREKVNAIEKDRDFSQRFTTAMYSITIALDSIDKMVSPESSDQQIAGNVAKLSQMIETDSVYNKDLYRNIASMLTSLHTIKKEKREANASLTSKIKLNSSDVESLNSQLNSAKTKITAIQDLVTFYEGTLDKAFVSQVRKHQP